MGCRCAVQIIELADWFVFTRQRQQILNLIPHPLVCAIHIAKMR